MMKRFLIITNIVAIAIIGYLIYSKNQIEPLATIGDYPKPISGLKYYDAHKLTVKGRLHQTKVYGRLLDAQRAKLDSTVARISNFSSGLYVEFKTSSQSISVKWSVLSEKELLNTSDIATRGLDLYCFTDGKWQFVNSAIPINRNNEQILISNLPSGEKLFRLHLPLFDTIGDLQIGILNGSTIAKFDSAEKQIIFYGTSITQGTGASRPGMAYPSIVGRELGIEAINLGISGQGKFQMAIAEILCSSNPEMVVLDCVPNSSPELIENNALSFIKRLRSCQPNTPILLVESIIREFAYFNSGDSKTFGSMDFINAQNLALRKSFDDATKAGITNIYYLEAKDLLGSDHEATVDGTHPSDLGYLRIADKVGKKIKSILEK